MHIQNITSRAKQSPCLKSKKMLHNVYTKEKYCINLLLQENVIYVYILYNQFDFVL